MKTLGVLVASLGLMVCFGTASSWAQGIVDNIAFVDPEYGTDSGTCGGDNIASGTGPCQSLNQAMQNLPATGGAVKIMNPGVFGPIYITGGFTIEGPQPLAGIDFRSGTLPGCLGGPPGSCNGNANAVAAVDVHTSATNSSVKLRYITVSAGSGAVPALHLASASAVTIQDGVLRCGSSSSSPATLLADSSQGSQMQIYVHDTDLGFCAGGGGMVLSPVGATPIRADINNSEVHEALFGLQANAGSLTGAANIQIIVDSTQFFSFNNSAISITAPSASNTAQFLVLRSNIVNTGGAGIKLNGVGAESVIYETAILGNQSGVNIVNGGTMATYQNNVIVGNGNECLVSGVNTPCSSALSPQAPD